MDTGEAGDRMRGSGPSSDTGVWPLIRLAAPLVVSRAGLASMTIIDCVMVARYDAGQLAYTSLAEGTFGRLTDVFAAFVLSALPLLAAAGAPALRARRHAIWRRSVAWALGLGATGLLAALFGRPILALMAQNGDLSRGAGAVIGILGFGLPAGLVAIASAVFLEATGRPTLVAACIVAANLLNLALNWLLIGGHWGLPAMGALGSAIGTSLVRTGLAVALVTAIRMREGPDVFRSGRRPGTGAAEQWRLGASMAGTSGSLHLLGLCLTVLAGWQGSLALAAYASGWVINMPAMLLAMGLGDAVAIRAAADQEWGTRRVLDRDIFGSNRFEDMNVIHSMNAIDSNMIEHDVVRKPVPTFRHHALDHDVFGWTPSKDMNVIDSNMIEHDVVRKPVPTFRHHALVGDLTTVALILAPFSLVLWAAPAMVAALYTPDPALRSMMIVLLPLSAIVLLLDGTSYGAAAALRGRRDIAGPATIQIACMAATPLLAATFAFGLQKGVIGMVWAVLATSAIRLMLLMLRLATRRGAMRTPHFRLEQDAPWG